MCYSSVKINSCLSCIHMTKTQNEHLKITSFNCGGVYSYTNVKSKIMSGHVIQKIVLKNREKKKEKNASCTMTHCFERNLSSSLTTHLSRMVTHITLVNYKYRVCRVIFQMTHCIKFSQYLLF